MKHALLSPLAFFALALAASAQINSGSYWTDGAGTTVRVDVVDPPGPGVRVQVTDATGFSPSVGGTAAAGSSEANPAAATFDPATTNAPDGASNTYRGAMVENEEHELEPAVQVQNAEGQWVTLRKAKKKKQGPPGSIEEHGALYFQAGPAVPFPDRGGNDPGDPRLPGDEVTSLPGPGRDRALH